MNNYELSPRSGNAFIAVGDSPRIMCDSARFRKQGRAPYVPARVAGGIETPAGCSARNIIITLYKIVCRADYPSHHPGHRGLSPTAIDTRALRALPSDTFLTECFHRAKRIYLCLCLGLIILGCDTRRDIVDDRGVWVRVEVDWTQVEMCPEGTSIYVFSQETGNRTAVLLTNEMRDGVAHDSIKLHAGNYSLLAFNDTERSHDYISFRGTDHYHTAEAYANPAAPAGDRYAPHATVQAAVAMDASEILAAAHLDHFEVDYEMIRNQSRPLLRLTPERRTAIVDVIVHVQNMRSLHPSARHTGALTNMAEGVFLSTGAANDIPATHWFTFDPPTFDEAANTGILQATFAAFNVPADETTPHLLPLYLLLRDGSAYDIKRDVTAQLHAAAATGAIYLRIEIGLGLSGNDPIILPDVSGGGFEVDIGGWDDNTNIDIPIGN